MMIPPLLLRSKRLKGLQCSGWGCGRHSLSRLSRNRKVTRYIEAGTQSTLDPIIEKEAKTTSKKNWKRNNQRVHQNSWWLLGITRDLHQSYEDLQMVSAVQLPSYILNFKTDFGFCKENLFTIVFGIFIFTKKKKMKWKYQTLFNSSTFCSSY